MRGLSEGFTRELVFAHVGGFLETACTGARSREVALGRDLRASSPQIAALVGGALGALGWTPINAGAVPTPALAAYALERGIPAIMVTGSHIPAAYNGLKFYRPDGELLKSDEEPIRTGARMLSEAVPEFDPFLPKEDPGAYQEYEKRYLTAFSQTALAGLKVAVFEHSSVGRDLLFHVLEALGASCTSVGRSEAFVAVDTEAVEPSAMAQIQAALATGEFDAVVSMDGDGDRPLLVDAKGNQISGDVLGALTARFLGAKSVVTPLTSTSALEQSTWFGTVRRTRIGSPYVVEEMAGQGRDGTVGFEANGGFLLEGDFALAHGRLKRLPTRDALLPIIAVLTEAVARDLPIGDLVAELPVRVMRADRLKDVKPDDARKLVEDLAQSSTLRASFDPSLATPDTIDTTDGTRLITARGDIVHFRRSGNAPELRCYVETGSAESTQTMLSTMIARLTTHLNAKGLQ
ncbi:phosphomannomutase [Pelagibacterium halotolerans B2]|uniref:Phosphomannomutase n=1 Tax=Pelagibacterium halotolerans (strain DSM 22347 / JCM 15775 / CGMCC 1.7692 / B2) TaxID=1082931 RepID=G4RGW7_PELHB|nr:phosphomannomutase [Pelagibacterium halotolerans B2]